jgi:hypothetical protein
MLVIERVTPPVLVNVTLCDALVVPTVWTPNAMLAADNDTVAGTALTSTDPTPDALA